MTVTATLLGALLALGSVSTAAALHLVAAIVGFHAGATLGGSASCENFHIGVALSLWPNASLRR
jgi:hypothetical protein